MSNLLRALLLRQNLLCAPAGEDLSTGGGAAADGGGGEEQDGQDADLADAKEDGDAEDGAADDADADDAGETVITLGAEPGEDDDADEEAIAAALGEDTPSNAAFAKLRAKKQQFKRALAQKEAEAAELRRQLQASKPAPPTVVVGPKPQAKDYELYEPEQAEKFEADLLAWTDRKAKADAEEAARANAQQQAQQRWEGRISAVDTAATALKVRDQEQATTAFGSTFSLVQQGIILGGPKDPKDAALLRYALGANPAIAKKLADIKDPVEFSFEAARLLFKELNVSTRKNAAPPPPERRLRSNVAGAAAVNDQLAKLEAEADKTGDRTKVAKFLRERNKQAA